ncbi:unnamed protein product [Rotaria magnacalcarata]|uniref:Uncharacterized protein n=2 Tax=Rotaria magnacalcarata TaxID=392030 RepID=A0A815YQR3_9BILA|nr:unnamed protein product [Rotaria magnacalcarata]CAF1572729.1 unnamed protein product [Rotaria magnacalcarata]CAF2147855.1 unnamed protein product [Rotaria magnacalcarata]CAF3748111.1 unnamed protein product [Rotaria magnacalcarata]CAF3782372.1 unnamed protein product [Rotaria magnacalcarata]
MGNQNTKPLSNMKTITPSTERITDRANQQQVIDLDEIVEKWVWQVWNRTKKKSWARYKREELLIKINWKRVTFIQSNANYYGLPPVRLPKSQILFRTACNNKTANEHSNVFKTERSTRSTFEFVFTKSLRKSHESFLIFRLPEEVIVVGGEIKREQSVPFGQNIAKEYDLEWNINTPVRVAPFTSTFVELHIDEEECYGDFDISIRFLGCISVTVATRQSPNTDLKLISGDIVQIIREALKNNNQLDGLEIIEEYSPVVKFTMHGKYSFRYGVQQHVVLDQESVERTSSSISTQNHIPSFSSTYRPLRTQLLPPTTDIALKIDEDKHYEIL